MPKPKAQRTQLNSAAKDFFHGVCLQRHAGWKAARGDAKKKAIEQEVWKEASDEAEKYGVASWTPGLVRNQFHNFHPVGARDA